MKIEYKITHEDGEISYGFIVTKLNQLSIGIEFIMDYLKDKSGSWTSPWVDCEIKLVKEN